MKMIGAEKFSLLAAAALAVAILAGCRTTSTADWNSRVGHLTYNQAVAELGSPSKQRKLSDGRLVVQWITLHSGRHLSTGMGSVGGFYGAGAGQNYQQTYRDHVLELTFGTNDVLSSWAKNY